MKIYYYLIITSLLTTSCVSFDSKSQFHKQHSFVFNYPVDQVWKAVQRTMEKYPLVVNNYDNRSIETDILTRANPVINLPHSSYDNNHNYVIKVFLADGDIEGIKSTKVMVIKSISVKKDFISAPQELPSDGYEEKIILERIMQELLILKKSGVLYD